MPSVIAIDKPVSDETQDDGGEDADRQCKQRRRQRTKADAGTLQPPGGKDHEHGANRHCLAMREIGKAQHRIDKCHAKRAERQLAAIGKPGYNHEIRQDHKGVQDIAHLTLPETPAAPRDRPSRPRRCRYRHCVPAPGHNRDRRYSGPALHSVQPSEWRFRSAPLQ